MSSRTETATSALAEKGLVFPESPRWYQDKLWLTDIFGKQLVTVELDGTTTAVARFDDHPSGLGFLPDGTALVGLMATRRIVRVADGQSRTHADLSSLPIYRTADMIVDARGRAYVGCIGAQPGESRGVNDLIVLIEPDGSFRTVAEVDLAGPNGLAIASNGERLVVGESVGQRISTFAIAADGSLDHRDLFAEDVQLDGLCVDAEDAVWVGAQSKGSFQRVNRGGNVDQLIRVERRWAIACVLGGSDRRTLFMATAKVPADVKLGLTGGNLGQSQGFIETADVNVPGAGIP